MHKQRICIHCMCDDVCADVKHDAVLCVHYVSCVCCYEIDNVCVRLKTHEKTLGTLPPMLLDGEGGYVPRESAVRIGYSNLYTSVHIANSNKWRII